MGMMKFLTSGHPSQDNGGNTKGSNKGTPFTTQQREHRKFKKENILHKATAEKPKVQTRGHHSQAESGNNEHSNNGTSFTRKQR